MKVTNLKLVKENEILHLQFQTWQFKGNMLTWATSEKQTYNVRVTKYVAIEQLRKAYDFAIAVGYLPVVNTTVVKVEDIKTAAVAAQNRTEPKVAMPTGVKKNEALIAAFKAEGLVVPHFRNGYYRACSDGYMLVSGSLVAFDTEKMNKAMTADENIAKAVAWAKTELKKYNTWLFENHDQLSVESDRPAIEKYDTSAFSDMSITVK